jgi:hypothetical protein
LEAALVQAKNWYDEREQLEEVIRRRGGSAQRNGDDRDAIERAAAPILVEIVEAVQATWGYA